MHNEKEKTKRKLKRSQDKGYSTKGAQISSAYSFVTIAIFFAAPFHRSSKWLAARCLMASRFLVFFLFGVVLARPFFPHFSPVDSKAVQRSALCRSRRELSNAYGVRKDDDTGQLKCSDAGLLCAGISDAVSTQKEAKAAAPGRRQKATSGDKGAKKARVAPKGK